MRTDLISPTQADFSYTFQRNLPGIGLMDYKARLRFVRPRSYCEEGFYDPTTGSFIQPDTVGGGNRYAYVGNNPIILIDTTGHEPHCPSAANCPQPPDGGFVSLAIGFSVGWVDAFWSISLDFVWNNSGQSALFISPMVEHGAVNSDKQVISSTEQCVGSTPCQVENSLKLMTPGANIALTVGGIQGEDFSKDITAYSGPFNVITGSLGEGGSLTFESFESVDTNTGSPNKKVKGAGFGINFGVGLIPFVGVASYSVNSKQVQLKKDLSK